MKYNKSIRIHKGYVSFEEKLGPYYLDLTQSIVDYTEGGYGEFDANGIPKYGRGDKADYNAVNIAQYGLIIHDLWWQNKANDSLIVLLYKILDWFESHKEESHGAIVWREKENLRYNLKNGFVSAMSQGEIISFYLRMFQINNDPKLLNTAKLAYDFFSVDVQNGGFRRYDEKGFLWFEEYPSEPPSYVLNGFIYALFGLYDLYRVTKSEKVLADIRNCERTLIFNVYKYDLFYWSIYDQLKKELVMVYYQRNAHVPQMDVMYELTGNDVFKFYRDKWQRNINILNILFVKLMYRIRPRMLNLRKFFLKDK